MARRLKTLVVLVVWALFLGPVAALIPASFLDQGSNGRVRISFFSIALTVLDPFVWTCAWNSLVVAISTTLLSLVLGVWIGHVIVKRGYGNVWLTLLLATCGLAMPPMFVALGLMEEMRALGLGSTSAPTIDWNWLVLVWAMASNGVPFVAMISIIALRKVDPVWEDSARLAGATPRKIWRKIIWPVARPKVARALCIVFGFSLLDPGTPSMLGLRRTIGFQIVQAAREGGLIGRAASLALFGLAAIALGRHLIAWWGGPWVASMAAREIPRRHPLRATWSNFLGLLPVIGIVGFFSALPLIGLLRGSESAIGREMLSISSPWIAIFEEPLLRDALIHSVQLGLLVVAVDLAVVKLLTWKTSESEGRERLTSFARITESFPPVVFGLGCFVLPSLLKMVPTIFGIDGNSRGPLALAVKTLAGWVDLRPGSWVPLVLAVAALRFSVLGRSKIETSWDLRPSRLDSVLLTGASRRRNPGDGWGGVSLASMLLTFSIAANAFAPAILLTPTAEIRTIGPTLLKLSDSRAPGRSLASSLAIIGIGLNLVSFAVIAGELRSRSSEPL